MNETNETLLDSFVERIQGNQCPDLLKNLSLIENLKSNNLTLVIAYQDNVHFIGKLYVSPFAMPEDTFSFTSLDIVESRCTEEFGCGEYQAALESYQWDAPCLNFVHFDDTDVSGLDDQAYRLVSVAGTDEDLSAVLVDMTRIPFSAT